MSQPQRPQNLNKPNNLSTAWSYGPRTLEWDRLWRRILSNTITNEDLLVKEEPNPEGISDDF